ncbi:DUF4328 domain-containing protein [Microbacterium sp. NPDC090218]
MTISSPPPSAGWYPAPDGSPGPWWWDGARWTQPHRQPVPIPPVATKAIAQLAVATQVLLIICGVVSVANIAVEGFGIASVTSYLDGNAAAMDMINTYDRSTVVVTILSSLGLLGAGVLWACWQYRVAKLVPGRTRRSPGWHAWSWFIPVACLWLPYQNISDLWRAAGRARPSWQIAWWLLWIASNVSIQVASNIYTNSQALEQFQVSMWMNIVGEGFLLAAAPLAWLTVRRITRGILQPTS